MATIPWHTAIADADVGGVGWLPLTESLEMTQVPIVDKCESLWARFTYRDAIAYGKSIGARLPTRGEMMLYIEAAKKGGVVLKPVTLSYGPEMVTIEQARKHDAQVKVMLESLSHDAQLGPIAGIGKHWVAGAAPGRSRIFGWWDGRRYIQMGTSDPHDDMHHDYATTTHLVRER